MSFRAGLAPRILPVVLANVTTRYPYHDMHLMKDGETAHDPFAAHPAFGNSFDWHSSVHSHWTALALIDHGVQRNAFDEVAELRDAVERNLQPDKLAAERRYLESRPSYERPYGWAWSMMLATRAPEVRPIAAWVASNVAGWIAMLPIPVRHGVHSNTAYALGLMWDAARRLGYEDVQRTIETRAREWFANDREWPQHAERSGNDFLSPGLTEADLMRRVLRRDDFRRWWSEFLPRISADSPILTPMSVPEVEDGHVVHLHGLNLSRARALANIARVLDDGALFESAQRLYAASESRAFSGNYTETHWLPTFAWDAAVQLDG